MKRLGGMLIVVLAMMSLLSACTPPSSIASRYGVNTASDNPGYLQDVQAAGFKWARLFVHWGDVGQWPGMEHDGEGRLNAAYLAQMDATVNALTDRGFAVDFVFNRIPDWARKMSEIPQYDMCKNYFPSRRVPASPTYFGNFMSEMATHFKARVSAYELFNEPNPNEHCEFPGSAAEFRTLMLEPGFDAIKAVDPNVIVLGPAVAGDTVAQDLTDYYTKPVNGQRVLDRPLTAAAVHQYGGLDQIMGVMNTANNFHPCTADGYCLGKYWLTEFGFDTSDAGTKSVQIFEHCDSQSNCGKAFYFDMDVDPNYAMIKLNSDGSVNSLRSKYYFIKTYITTQEALLPK